MTRFKNFQKQKELSNQRRVWYSIGSSEYSTKMLISLSLQRMLILLFWFSVFFYLLLQIYIRKYFVVLCAKISEFSLYWRHTNRILFIFTKMSVDCFSLQYFHSLDLLKIFPSNSLFVVIMFCCVNVGALFYSFFLLTNCIMALFTLRKQYIHRSYFRYISSAARFNRSQKINVSKLISIKYAKAVF